MIALIHPYLIKFAPLPIAAVTVYLLACCVLLFGQSRFIFFPSRDLTTTPEDVNLSYQDVWLPVCSNQNSTEFIHGWWIPSSQDSNQPVMIHLHGNSSNIGANLGHAQQFHQMGLSVLLIDYRGFGQSTPRIPSEKVVYQDAEAAWNYLVNQKEINPEKIFIFGHSLGGAIAINLATKYPQIAGLIVESSFTSMGDMADYQGKYGMFPIHWLLQQRFASIEKVNQLKMPILFTHGTADTVVPVEMSEALYAAATEPKQLLIVEEADHNNVRQVGEMQYFNTIQEFIQQTLKLQYQ
ncbi:MAG: alpha/beta fold hydrolase [Microcoleaceae cyanobacterium]